jgi:GT2 family glycosyltransferase
VKSDVEAAFITVGHARPAVNICLQAGIRHFKDPKLVAVYADQVPHQNATTFEKSLYYFSWPIYRRLKKGAHAITKVHAGMTQGTGCMIRIKTWQEHKFDEAYGHGGEDLAWGRWAVKAGHGLIYDPAVITHHSHGLSFINFMRQIRYWIYIAFNKGEFSTQKVMRYRPDLADKLNR